MLLRVRSVRSGQVVRVRVPDTADVVVLQDHARQQWPDLPAGPLAWYADAQLRCPLSPEALLKHGDMVYVQHAAAPEPTSAATEPLDSLLAAQDGLIARPRDPQAYPRARARAQDRTQAH